MKLEVGEYYLNYHGGIVKNDTFKNESKNIIAHIPKELHKHILNEINSYYTDKDFMETVKSVWSDK